MKSMFENVGKTCILENVGKNSVFDKGRRGYPRDHQSGESGKI